MFKIFGKHYGTERFFVLLFVLFFSIVSLAGYSVYLRAETRKFSVGSTPLYTGAYTWSRTSAPGSVVSLVSNKNRTAVFLLIKNNDVSLTSTNADDYQVFMKGTDEPMTNVPAMTVYSFGMTGYVGFYFTDSRGFANQRYTLTFRADSAGSDAADESMFYTGVRDQSFRDHNQMRIILNFGASGMPTLPVMDEPNLTPMKIMCDLNLDLRSFGLDSTASDFEGMKKSAQDQLDNMSKTLVSIKQYRATLDDNGIIVPDLPYYIANDYIDKIPNNFNVEPTVFEIDMMGSAVNGSSGTQFTGVDSTSRPGSGDAGDDSMGGSSGEAASHQYTYLHTDYLYPGTASINWQDRKLSDGLITQTRFWTDESMSLAEAYQNFASWSKDCAAEYSKDMPVGIKFDTWRRKDGSYLDLQNPDPLERQVIQVINQYTTAVGQYMNLKNSYLKLNTTMLQVEGSIQALRSMIYSNNGSKQQNLWLY